MKTFEREMDAQGAGYYHIRANRVLSTYSTAIGEKRLICRDISGANYFGYDFKIIVQECRLDRITGWLDWFDTEQKNEPKSITVYLSQEKTRGGSKGAYSSRFDFHEIEKFAKIHTPGQLFV